MKNRVNQIDSYMKRLVMSVIQMNEKYFILKTLKENPNFWKTFHKKFKNSHGGKAFNDLIILIWHDFIREQFRLFLDEQKKAASLSNLHRKISEPKLHNKLRERFCEQMKDLDYSITESSTIFDKGWEENCNHIQKLKQDSIAKNIKTFRDKYYEHLEMAPLDSDSPLNIEELNLNHKELLKFAENNTTAVFKLNKIIRNDEIVHESVSNLYYHRSCEMWRILAGLES